MEWKIISASAQGCAHAARREPCQDAAYWMESNGVLVAIVCDGAGSAAQGEYGAQHGAQTICREILYQFSENHYHPDREELAMWIKIAIRTARKTLPGVLDEEDMARYHATLVGALFSAEVGLFFHIGDGAALASNDNTWSRVIMSQPENGRDINKTYFYTQSEWYRHLRIQELPASVRSFALMSDGACKLALQDGLSLPLQPFYFETVRQLVNLSAEQANQRLAAILQDPSMNNQTTDDRTLLLAIAGG